MTVATMTFEDGIPFDAVLIGFHIYAQAYALAPGENPFDGIASNGIDWQIGGY